MDRLLSPFSEQQTVSQKKAFLCFIIVKHLRQSSADIAEILPVPASTLDSCFITQDLPYHLQNAWGKH